MGKRVAKQSCVWAVVFLWPFLQGCRSHPADGGQSATPAVQTNRAAGQNGSSNILDRFSVGTNYYVGSTFYDSFYDSTNYIRLWQGYRSYLLSQQIQSASQGYRSMQQKWSAVTAPRGWAAILAKYAVVRVYYATDRLGDTNLPPGQVFGGRRGELSYGHCDVSIPRDHRMGELEQPSIWKLEWSEDPEKHVVLLSLRAQSPELFYSDVRSRVNGSRGRNALVFIHGYNVTFADAARRTAQLSYDLAFDGAAVFYSWPSQGTLLGYPNDESNIEWTQSDLQKFLDDFALTSGADNIYVIAHSMGNRALTRAFAALVARDPAVRAKFRELILTAPDLDAAVFKRDIAPQILSERPLVTLYASVNDKALVASERFHGYPRLGDAGPGMVVLPGMDTIDASAVDTSFIGHSYFADNRSVLSDIFYLIRDGLPAGQKPRQGLELVGGAATAHWKINP